MTKQPISRLYRDELCSVCEGAGGWRSDGAWHVCEGCGGSGKEPTRLGQEVLEMILRVSSANRQLRG